MTDFWSGDILLPDSTTVTDITLATLNVASLPLLPATPLRFLSTVDTARIPLHLAAGPSLDVFTSNEETEQWFQSILLSKVAREANASEDAVAQDWWSCARSQSPIGILVQVDGEVDTGGGPRITEILFYGTIVGLAERRLPTPPSSSPDIPHAQSEDLPELRVHALPLSSDLLYRVALPQDLPTSLALSVSELPAEREPQFLPSRVSSSITTPSSPKRKRDIFDEATQLQKKARRKGGEGVSAAAGKVFDSQTAYGHRKSLSIDAKTTPISDSRPSSANGLLSRPPSRPLSRSPSISSDTRPLNKKGLADGHTKRSNLSQVATVSLQPEEPTIETRNKEALSRVVMTAMRMYGLEQRKKTKSWQGAVASGMEAHKKLSTEQAAGEALKDEEYKLIYHQTFKGAALALRGHITSKPLHAQPDRLRDVVERLLAIFCIDPLAQPLPIEEPPDPLATPGSKHRLRIPNASQHHASPFDMPSGNRVSAVKSTAGIQVHTGSPVSKRREGETVLDVFSIGGV
ncbi:hypothetical protein K504DRAFT_375566 [Pleomassaria siparia CBS 279.74]|uniref:Sld7 C-terminal domain-containing protein n=1 Tax=Pleomassaria siparia CBS 279.74 TaxID=1314801 RepID=A0A6G1KD17_9PLEO|nr:hypothetical protein K504DRAFT_375566 [Pleomassaria siparia CBS 279.74]